MKVVIATPLYPPEVAEPAPYVKELAQRLGHEHEVTVVAYAHLPEPVAGIQIIAVEKRQPLLSRLFAFTGALRRASKNADVMYAINGSSVELPVILLSLATRTPIVFGMADLKAHQGASGRLFAHMLERVACKHAEAVIKDFPLPRPEILPLESYPEDAFNHWEASWSKHLEKLTGIFQHAK